jgi:hypothetical protein
MQASRSERLRETWLARLVYHPPAKLTIVSLALVFDLSPDLLGRSRTGNSGGPGNLGNLPPWAKIPWPLPPTVVAAPVLPFWRRDLAGCSCRRWGQVTALTRGGRQGGRKVAGLGNACGWLRRWAPWQGDGGATRPVDRACGRALWSLARGRVCRCGLLPCGAEAEMWAQSGLAAGGSIRACSRLAGSGCDGAQVMSWRCALLLRRGIGRSQCRPCLGLIWALFGFYLGLKGWAWFTRLAQYRRGQRSAAGGCSALFPVGGVGATYSV